MARTFSSRALLCLALACVLLYEASGCQPQLCRRRRGVKNSVVKLQLDGCTGQSPTWTRQIAYCLNLRVTTMTLGIKTWYTTTYEECANTGCATYIDTKGGSAVDECVQCWKDAISFSEDLLLNFSVSREDVTKCMTDYIHAFLNKDLPVFKSENRFKSHVDLADVRAAEYWWSVTVKLPCEPKVFVYWNAYCINSFAREWTEGEYTLVQNNLINKDRISFYVKFGDSCTFEPEEIEIIWDESTPASALPQVSSFPSHVPPRKKEKVNIYYDLEAARRLKNVDDDEVKEDKGALKSRRKREAGHSRLAELGLEFPCEVRSFQSAGAHNGKRSYGITDSASRRFLIDTDIPCSKDDRFCNRTSFISFDLDYGYETTGCIFNSGAMRVVPSPPENWVHQTPTSLPSKEIFCASCINKPTNRDCLGAKSECASGEVCQTEVRHVTETEKLITKSCKQKSACNTNALGTISKECTPGVPGSVCRCCCNTTMCNTDDKHHAGELFICQNSTL